MASMVILSYCKLIFPCISFIIVLAQCNAMHCESKEMCDECIQTFDCAWCLKTVDSNLGIHCFNKSAKNVNCPGNNIINPKPLQTIILNKQIQTAASSNNVVQIAPQQMRLQLRKDEEHTIGFQFGQSSDFPVDLYYIMDLSHSLKADKNNLAHIGKELVTTMQGITRDFHIGFGSFVDKTDAPFINTQPEKVAAPCAGCAPAYSFKNHLSLTANGARFSDEVGQAPLSANLDVPEGGFDALMQAIVCQEVIGWRNYSTRIIVFTTDAAFHVAGDGKLAGVVTPHDGECHMTNNEYTDTLKYDYPSVSHINYVAKQHNVHILFAVKEKVENIYKSLEKVIENSKTVKLLDNEIIPEIKNFYQNISSSVKFVSTQSPNVYLQYSSDCMGDNQDFSKTIDCLGVSPGQILNIKAMIKPIRCFDHEEVIRIKASTQDATLEIRLKTTCTCEECGPDALNSAECNHHGGLHCGVCKCDAGFSGKQCECDQSKNEEFEKFDKCKNGNETDICSGRGSCRCNVCNCNKKDGGQLITGKYCECDNFSCPKWNSVVCGNHGECVCGQCKCNPDWSGDSCECLNDLTACTQDGVVCNGQGTCKCGKCMCIKPYFGRYCDDCSTCYGGKCDELKPCVECKVHKKGKYKDDCDIKCTQYTINVADTIDDDEVDDSKVCRYIEENCKLVFTYNYTNDKLVAFTPEDLQCTEPINLTVLICSIVGGILLIGIMSLIIWKLWTNHKDKIEYAKFIEEKDRARWQTDGNPIFKSPVMEFQNPTYGNRQSSIHQRKTHATS